MAKETRSTTTRSGTGRDTRPENNAKEKQPGLPERTSNQGRKAGSGGTTENSGQKIKMGGGSLVKTSRGGGGSKGGGKGSKGNGRSGGRNSGH